MKSLKHERLQDFIRRFIKHDKIDNPSDDYYTLEIKAIKKRKIIHDTPAYTYNNESVISFKKFIQESKEL